MPYAPALTVLTVTSALLVGLVLALLGNLKLALARRPEQTHGSIRRYLSLLNFLLIPLVAGAGVLVDVAGVRVMLVAGSVLLALALVSLSAPTTFARTFLATLVAALGASILWVATVVLLPSGLFGPREVTASCQVGLVIMALGALLTPPLFDVLLHAIGLRRTMALFALVLLAPAFLAAVPRADEFPIGSARHLLFEPLNDPAVWLAAAVFFVYAPLEAFVSVWTTTYLTTSSQPQKQSWWLAGFWTSLLLSRVLFGYLQHVIQQFTSLGTSGDGWFLVLSAALAAVVLGNMAGTVRGDKAFWGLILLGFALGPLFPILVGILFQYKGVEAAPGTTFGALHAAGSVGSLLLSPLVNLSASARTIQTALRIPLFIALLLTAVTVVFALVTRPM
jgi:hypothetical protein